MSMPPSKVFFISCCAFVSGVATTALVYRDREPFFLFLALLAACAFGIVFRTHSAVRLPAVFCMLFLFGMLRMAWSADADGKAGDVLREAAPVRIQGVVRTEPQLAESRQTLFLRVQQMSGMDGTAYGFRAVRVFAPLMSSYQYGDELSVRCILLPQKDADARIARTPVCAQADIERVSGGKGNKVLSLLFRGKEFFLHGIRAHLSEPHASFLGALLVGDRSGFPRLLTEAFAKSGILHIVAISGYNIAIMIAAAYAALRACSVGRKQSFWYIMVSVVCFTVITGASASVVRAAIMGIVALFAQYIGRRGHGENALLLAASVMVLWQPEILFSLGFQLSFAATCGLMYLFPIVTRACKNMPNAYGIRDMALQTMSATLCTAPLLVFSFQQFSAVSLVANMLVLPVIPLIMALGFLWAGAAAVLGALAGVVSFSFDALLQMASWPIWFLLSYIIAVAQWFSHMPLAAVEVRLGDWDWVFVYVSYAVIIWFVWLQRTILKKKERMVQCEHAQKAKEL